MNSFWNKGEREIIKGLDILGLRGIDQHIETQLVSSITTISIRARYLSLLPWLVGEFFHLHEGETNLDSNKMRHLLMQAFDRLELIIILSTDQEKQKDPTLSDTGIIGREVHEKWEEEFKLNGEIDTVILKEKANKTDYNNPTFGTYYNPCRGFGLLTHSPTAPVALPPHGQSIYDVRKGFILRENGILQWLLHGGLLTKSIIEKESELFSIANITSVPEEEKLLQEAFLKPYGSDQRVIDIYEKFDNTILWVLEHIEEEKRPKELIEDNFTYCVSPQQKTLSETEIMWFEFELRRRSHYALELLLKALSNTLGDSGSTVERVVEQWMEEIESSDVYYKGRATYESIISDFDNQLDESIFIQKEPIDSAEQALYALSLLEVCRLLSSELLEKVSTPEGTDYMRKSFYLLESNKNKPVYQALVEIVKFCAVEPHLKTTLRKMGQGADCSLRFFPEGQKLIPTGIETYAGQSGSRLDNTIRMMSDIGICDQVNGNTYKKNDMSDLIISQLREAV